jgi:hypothetical protein
MYSRLEYNAFNNLTIRRRKLVVCTNESFHREESDQLFTVFSMTRRICSDRGAILHLNGFLCLQNGIA